MRKEIFYKENWEEIHTYSIETFRATIYLGMRPGYESGITENPEKAKEICQEFCNINGLCVSVKDIEFIYKNGNEKGLEIGLINYPRFPRNTNDITKLSLELASILKEEYSQYRVSVVCTDKTYMIGELD